MDGTPIRVAIAGGGVAGLALAAGLAKKPHIDVHVYEAVREYRDVGAGLALHLNATRALSLIDPGLRQAYLDKALAMADEEDRVMATEVILAQGPHSGQHVAELGRARGRKTVSRADLLDGFLDLVPRPRVSFGKRLVAVEEARHEGTGEGAGGSGEVTLFFQDGSRATADCLLGADGVHSLVRRHMLGGDHPAASPKNHDGWQIYRVMVSTEEARREIDPKWTQSVPILLGPRGHINCIPLNKNTRLTAGVAIRRGAGANFTAKTWDGTDDGRSQPRAESSLSSPPSPPPPLDPDLYSDYSPDAQAIVRMIASRAGTSQSTSWALSDHDHAPFYAQAGSRVAVLGDAAHAALPFAGNGAAQALEDAAVLDCLFGALASSGVGGGGGGDDDDGSGQTYEAIEDVLLAFDYVRRPRSQAVVDLARKFGRIYAYAEDGSKPPFPPPSSLSFLPQLHTILAILTLDKSVTTDITHNRSARGPAAPKGLLRRGRRLHQRLRRPRPEQGRAGEVH